MWCTYFVSSNNFDDAMHNVMICLLLEINVLITVSSIGMINDSGERIVFFFIAISLINAHVSLRHPGTLKLKYVLSFLHPHINHRRVPQSLQFFDKTPIGIFSSSVKLLIRFYRKKLFVFNKFQTTPRYLLLTLIICILDIDVWFLVHYQNKQDIQKPFTKINI